MRGQFINDVLKCWFNFKRIKPYKDLDEKGLKKMFFL